MSSVVYGVTVESFDQKMQQEFIDGVAAALKVPSKRIIIISVHPLVQQQRQLYLLKTHESISHSNTINRRLSDVEAAKKGVQVAFKVLVQNQVAAKQMQHALEAKSFLQELQSTLHLMGIEVVSVNPPRVTDVASRDADGSNRGSSGGSASHGNSQSSAGAVVAAVLLSGSFSFMIARHVKKKWSQQQRLGYEPASPDDDMFGETIPIAVPQSAMDSFNAQIGSSLVTDTRYDAGTV